LILTSAFWLALRAELKASSSKNDELVRFFNFLANFSWSASRRYLPAEFEPGAGQFTCEDNLFPIGQKIEWIASFLIPDHKKQKFYLILPGSAAAV
jgi:hypothetical protein